MSLLSLRKTKLHRSLILNIICLLLTACTANPQASADTPFATPVPTTALTASPSVPPVPTTALTASPSVPPALGSDFYHVENTNIVDSSGNPVWLNGIAFGNMIWSSYDPNESDHDEASFQELAELGFNCVRFYLSYHYFEEEANPYVYKESGFKWLNQNIAWAKKHNIRLILNMHAPQGGYQSQGEGLALWQEPENQKRLIALWTEIAKRYADEESIIGYGLINEPVVPLLEDLSATVEQCSSLMQRITDSIRTYDQNHIIFVERLCAAVDPTTGEADWSIPLEATQFLINDPNTVYEFHCYTPHHFTHQNMDWAGTGGKIETYPSTESVFQDPVNYWVGCGWSEPIETLADGWQLYESGFSSRSDEYNVGSITLHTRYLGAGGRILFDDVILEEYQNGEFRRIVKQLDFEAIEESDDFYFWSSDNSGSYIYLNKEGYQGSRCVAICDIVDDANISGYKFELKEDCEYRIRAKVKYVNTEHNSSGRPRIDYSLFKTVTNSDIEYLEATLMPYIEFGNKHQVPIYLGEFGVCYPAWEANTGAGRWVNDMLSLCQKYRLHFDYHAYHDYWFGLYRTSPVETDAVRNEALAKIFRSFLIE